MVPKIKLDPDIHKINLYIKLYFSACNLYKENEWELFVDWLSDRQHYALPSLKGINIDIYTFVFKFTF